MIFDLFFDERSELFKKKIEKKRIKHDIKIQFSLKKLIIEVKL